MSSVNEFLERLSVEDAILVSVERSSGSVPREAGAWMAVFDTGELGTIGGGQLEHQAMAEARDRLRGRSGEAVLRFPLGPSLGQCCGGVVFLRFERVSVADRGVLAQRLRVHGLPVALFGGGHVGAALIELLGRLPCSVT